MFRKLLVLISVVLGSLSLQAAMQLKDEIGQSVAMGEQKKLEVLLEKAKNVDYPLSHIHETPLTLAALNGRAQMVEMLLKRGAQVNYQTTNGWTALMFAVQGANSNGDFPATIRALLRNGADKTLKNKDGETAETLALKKKNQNVLEALQ